MGESLTMETPLLGSPDLLDWDGFLTLMAENHRQQPDEPGNVDSLTSAQDLDRLAKANYETTITNDSNPTRMFSLIVIVSV